MPINPESRYTEVLAAMTQDRQLSPYLNLRLKIPQVHRGSGLIRLIILGQDPTVKDETSRVGINKVLNLKGHGALHNYLQRICLELGLNLNQNVYATNFVKNFFVAPPTQIKEIDVLALAAKYWMPLLHEELDEFPDAPVITLGQPLLTHIINKGARTLVRDYWDYKPHWGKNPPTDWRLLEPHENVLNRVIFPLPHQPSYTRKPFYHTYLPVYLRFAKSVMTGDG